MADKRKENKVMAMLERTGVIRKADSDGSLDSDSDGGLSRDGSNIKPIFDTPDSTVKVTPAARQPVPGMPSPVFPSEKAANIREESAPDDESFDIDEELARAIIKRRNLK